MSGAVLSEINSHASYRTDEPRAPPIPWWMSLILQFHDVVSYDTVGILSISRFPGSGASVRVHLSFLYPRTVTYNSLASALFPIE